MGTFLFIKTLSVCKSLNTANDCKQPSAAVCSAKLQSIYLQCMLKSDLHFQLSNYIFPRRLAKTLKLEGFN